MRILSSLPYPNTSSGGATIALDALKYANGRTALLLIKVECSGYEELYVTLTCNLPDEPLAPDEVFIKYWSENEGLDNWAETQNILGELLGTVPTGYVQAAHYRLHPEFIAKLEAARSLEERAQGASAKQKA